MDSKHDSCLKQSLSLISLAIYHNVHSTINMSSLYQQLSVSYSHLQASFILECLKIFHITTGQYIYIYIYIYAITYLIKYLYLISNFNAPYMYIIIISLNDSEINHSYMYT